MSGASCAGAGGLRGHRGTMVDTKRPKYSVLHVAGAGWIVLDPEGVKCGGTFGTKDGALTRCDAMQAEADRRAKRGERPCLCCGAVFESAGIHNRLCDICKRRGGDSAPHGIVLPRRRTA